jgi:hypothetical protein
MAFESYEIDLAVSEEMSAFEKEVASSSGFFKPVNDVSYKIKFTSSKLTAVEKAFKDGPKIKYVAQIEAITKDGSKFIGSWELGPILADQFVKGYKEKGLSQVYIYTKTGSDLQTKHSLVKDF